jgi:hypothetical protein
MCNTRFSNGPRFASDDGGRGIAGRGVLLLPLQSQAALDHAMVATEIDGIYE